MTVLDEIQNPKNPEDTTPKTEPKTVGSRIVGLFGGDEFSQAATSA
jgi:hypothetical protein